MASRRIDAKTPHGGTYSILYFLNIDHEEVEEEKATNFELIEFDADGEQVWRTYGEVLDAKDGDIAFA